MVDADRPGLTGLTFIKMVGSGNDFVFLDGREPALRALERPEVVQRICARRSGVGADGVVWLLPETDPGVAYRMRYYNADGSLAGMCGNAALCSITLATRLGLAPDDRAFVFASDAGLLRGRRQPDGSPSVEMPPLRPMAAGSPVTLRASEQRIGSIDSGVPHVVVLVDDAESVDVTERGRTLRQHPAWGPAGANVNFVQAGATGAWRMRTYERGVEGETLACGTGSVATAALLQQWGLSGPEVRIETSSGLVHEVTLPGAGQSVPTLSGEGRVVFEGRFGRL
jgi:diaminopimelate epimerase